MPVILLAMGWLDWLEPGTALFLAMGWVVLRLGSFGVVVRRLAGELSPFRVLMAGIGLTAVAASIALLKLITTY